MDDRLRVDNDLDLIGADTKQPPGFDDFQCLVHHGGRVDGDLATHIPSRVVQSLFDGDAFELCREEDEEAGWGDTHTGTGTEGALAIRRNVSSKVFTRCR